MSDYGTMQNRIADEIARSDLTTPIQRSIISAIQHWQRHRFYFNESRTVTFNTVASQEFYTSSDNAYIPTFADIDAVTITALGSRMDVDKRPYHELEELSSTTTLIGIPIYYAYYGQQLRLYPIPDGVYPVRVSGLQRLDNVSLSADTNVWFTEAEALIRARAKIILALDVLKDADEARRLEPLENSVHTALQRETVLRGKSNVKPTQF